jgi:hypothetical protein
MIKLLTDSTKIRIYVTFTCNRQALRLHVTDKLMLVANIDIGCSVSANGSKDQSLFTWASPWLYEGTSFLWFKNTHDPNHKYDPSSFVSSR